MKEIVVLVITDLVDSTRLASSLGTVAAAQWWADHDATIRRLLHEHGGREIDKSDGFLVLFRHALSAIRFAEAYHTTAATLRPPVKIRVGVHQGEVVLTENPADDVAQGAKPLEVQGVAKSLTARLASIAVGGQTLVTGPILEALGDEVQPVHAGAGRVAVPWGHWRLKGVDMSVPLFEVGQLDEAPLTPPLDTHKAMRVVERFGEWIPVRDILRNLPAERDAFVGRVEALRALDRAFRTGARLVTLLGAGGTGKTRLATRFGWRALADHPGGVWFCDLADARTIEGIAYATASGLKAPLGGADPISAVASAIAERGRCLVVLDNFEQVVPHAAATVGQWLDRTEDAHFLVTSRETLGLPGEAAHPLPPLPLDAAVALFTERVAAAGVPICDADGPAVESLVELLDRLPLAIELAAARARVMPPGVLLERMGSRFQLLATRGGRVPRHATLRATLDWSWNLLDPVERTALTHLSVFEGGFTLEAAEAVLDVPGWPADALQALVDKSLVRRLDHQRFDQLATVKAYAQDHLDDGGMAACRHGACFAQLGSPEGLAALDGPDGARLRRRTSVETENTVAACRRALDRRDEATAIGTLGALVRMMQVPPGTLLVLLDDLLAWVAPGSMAWGYGHKGRVDTFLALGRPAEALDAANVALGTFRARAKAGMEAWALNDRGRCHLALREFDEARDCFTAAQAAHRRNAHRFGEGIALLNQARCCLTLEQQDAAGPYLDQAEALFQEHGSPWGRLRVLSMRAELHRQLGELEAAEEAYGRAVETAVDMSHQRWEAEFRCVYGEVLLQRGRLEDAWSQLDGAVSLARKVGHAVSEGLAHSHMGQVCAARGQIAEAQRLLAAGVELSRRARAWGNAAVALCRLAMIDLRLGRLADAHGRLEELAVLPQEQITPREHSFGCAVLGALAEATRDLQRARERYEQAIRLAQEGRDAAWEGMWLHRLGALLVQQQQPREAAGVLSVAEGRLRHSGNPNLLAQLLATCAGIAHDAGEPERARALLAEAEAVTPPGFVYTEARLAELRGTMGRVGA